MQHLELVARGRASLECEVRTRCAITFPEPKPLLTATRRIMGLDGQAKMSKSLGNTIGLLESPEEVWAKLRPAMTDPARVRRTDPGTPEVCNIYHLHKAFNRRGDGRARRGAVPHGRWGCLDCKKVLMDGMMRELTPIRERALELECPPPGRDGCACCGRGARR